MAGERELLAEMYAAFNRRDAEAVLKRMHPQVDWPNGMEGGRVHGHDGVRAYWKRQWGMIDPHVEPVGFTAGEGGETAVAVHQVVRDLEGKVLQDQRIEHVYVIEDGLIRSMEIRNHG